MGCIKRWRLIVATLAVGGLVLTAYGDRDGRASKDKSGVGPRVEVTTPDLAPAPTAGAPQRLLAPEALNPTEATEFTRIVESAVGGSGSAAAGVEGATSLVYATGLSGYVAGPWNVDALPPTCPEGTGGFGDQTTLFGVKSDGTTELEYYDVAWYVGCQYFARDGGSRSCITGSCGGVCWRPADACTGGPRAGRLCCPGATATATTYGTCDAGTSLCIGGSRNGLPCCPGNCSVTTATQCDEDTDCPAGETCINIGACDIPPDPPFNVTTVLWDGSPCAGGAMIPGTMCVFSSARWRSNIGRCVMDKALIPDGDLWITAGADNDDFWMFIGTPPNPGTSLGNADFYIDSDGDGCYDTWDCFDLSPVFGCDGTPFGFGKCDWMWVPEIRANAQVAIKVVPVPPFVGSKHVATHTYTIRQKGAKQDEAVLLKGGEPVWLEIRMTNFDPKGPPGPGGTGMTGWQTRIDSSGYTSGLQGYLTPYFVNCTGNAVCAGQLGTGSVCAPLGYPANTCAYADIFTGRSDYLLQGGFKALDVSTLDTGYLGAASAPVDNFLPVDQQYYLGHIVVEVSPDAKGQFTVGLLDFPETQTSDQDGQFLPLVALIPGYITVEVGQCCYGVGADTAKQGCVDEVTQNQCRNAGTCKDATGGGSGAFCLPGPKPGGKDVECPAGETCVVQGVNLWNPDKTCADDCAECTVAADCDDGVSCTNDSCDTSIFVCVNTPNNAKCDDGLRCNGVETCDAVTGCSNPPDVDCNDGLACTTDTCVEPTGTCRNVKRDCRDADPCTIDSCTEPSGACSNVLLPSVGGPGCPITGADLNDCLASTIDQYTGASIATAFDPATGCCLCVLCCNDTECDDTTNPCPPCTANLAFDIHPGKTAPGTEPNCFAQGQKITVDVVASDTLQVINGAQFVVNYDPTCVSFNSISPGGFPYVFELEEIVDRANGRIFYAVGVDPFGGVGAFGGVLARISFTKTAHPNCSNCNFSFGGVKPMEPKLVNDDGQPICAIIKKSKEIHVNDRLTLNIPRNAEVNSDCDRATANVTWAAPTASSSCARPGCDPSKEKCYQAELVCTGLHESGRNESSKAMGGGVHLQGITRYECCATSNICGDSVCKQWTVTVTDDQSLDIELQLSPIMAGPVERCINFQLYSDCVRPPVAFQQEVMFGGQGDFIGKFTDKKKVPKGQYVCITAQDQQHSVRACDFIECIGSQWFASLTGDPFFGGKWLIQGNLDGWKKANPNASTDHIDILDFGQFVAQYRAVLNPNTTCAAKHDGPHADINGDGIVDALDFSFIALNFLTDSNDCCCPESQPAGSVARTEVTVYELREMGLPEFAVADLNGDGLVNMDDMAAFMAGQVPTKKTPDRDRSGLGGSR